MLHGTNSSLRPVAVQAVQRVKGGAAKAADHDLEKIEQALSDLVRLTASARVHDARVRGSGVEISRTHLRFLDAALELGPVSVSKLASRMDLSQPTASRALQQLEADGYVERTSDPADGRVAFYSATHAGREAHQRMRRFMAGQLAEALRDMRPERRSDMAQLLTELVTRLSVSQPQQAGPG
jgi:DNA-binding MarR family transcriptional regulator